MPATATLSAAGTVLMTVEGKRAACSAPSANRAQFSWSSSGNSDRHGGVRAADRRHAVRACAARARPRRACGLQKYAVRCGGGFNHASASMTSILIKTITSLWRAASGGARARPRRAGHLSRSRSRSIRSTSCAKCSTLPCRTWCCRARTSRATPRAAVAARGGAGRHELGRHHVGKGGVEHFAQLVERNRPRSRS